MQNLDDLLFCIFIGLRKSNFIGKIKLAYNGVCEDAVKRSEILKLCAEDKAASVFSVWDLQNELCFTVSCKYGVIFIFDVFKSVLEQKTFDRFL